MWAVIAAPLLPLLTGMYCMFKIRERSPVGLFETLLQQLRTDLDALGKVSPL
jgi:hypothetical protein